MNSSEWYRRAPGQLAGVVLLLSCFLLSGCKLTHLLGPYLLDDLFGDLRDQFPTVVLSVDQPVQKVAYTFDWKETTIGGAKVGNFDITSDYWRMNVFTFSDGTLIGDYRRFKSIETEPAETFSDLPLEKLLLVQLDLADNEEGTKNRKSYSFAVLFHYDK